MSRILLLVDGVADYPHTELEDRSPMEAARMPAADRLAAEGICGQVAPAPGNSPDSSRALLAEACGLPSRVARALLWGPIGALRTELPPDPARSYHLARFVTHTPEGGQEPSIPSSAAEQRQLLGDLEQAIGAALGGEVHLRVLQRGRYVLSLPGPLDPPTTRRPLWDRLSIRKRLPPRLALLHEAAEACLRDHPANAVRIDLGENPLDGLWLWSGGEPRPLPPRRAIPPPLLVSADPLAGGLARALSLPFLELAAPTPSLWRELLDNHPDIVFWIAASRHADSLDKVRHLEALDQEVLAPLRTALDPACDRLLLLAAGLRHREHPAKAPLPFVLWPHPSPPCPTRAWNESASRHGEGGTLSFSRLQKQMFSG